MPVPAQPECRAVGGGADGWSELTRIAPDKELA